MIAYHFTHLELPSATNFAATERRATFASLCVGLHVTVLAGIAGNGYRFHKLSLESWKFGEGGGDSVLAPLCQTADRLGGRAQMLYERISLFQLGAELITITCPSFCYSVSCLLFISSNPPFMRLLIHCSFLLFVSSTNHSLVFLFISLLCKLPFFSHQPPVQVACFFYFLLLHPSLYFPFDRVACIFFSL